MIALLLCTILAWTNPVHSADPKSVHPRYQDIPWIDASDLGEVRAYGVRQSVTWATLVSEWRFCHTRADSNATLEIWWPTVRLDAAPHLVRVKGERGRMGLADTMSVALGGCIRWFVVARDTNFNDSQRSEFAK